MATTHRTIALSQLAKGMIVRREVQGVPADYRVVNVIRERRDRKLWVFAYTEPVDNTHGDKAHLHPALYHATNKPVVKVA